jgi:hypothetical protein
LSTSSTKYRFEAKCSWKQVGLGYIVGTQSSNYCRVRLFANLQGNTLKEAETDEYVLTENSPSRFNPSQTQTGSSMYWIRVVHGLRFSGTNTSVMGPGKRLYKVDIPTPKGKT